MVAPAPPPQTAPMILSPALAPIPGKVVEKTRKGLFVDFKGFLADNTMLLQRLTELSQAGAVPVASQPLFSSSRMREVSDPLTWASCFLAFMAAKTEHEDTHQLAAYGMIILQLVRKHGGSGWLLYDRQFRLQQAAGAGLSWVETNSSLLAATVLGQPSEKASRTCSLCLSADHSREECALASLEHQRNPPSLQPHRPPHPHCPLRHSHQYRSHNTCYRFNSGSCNSVNCRFDHVCSGCYSPGHIEAHCPNHKGLPKGRLMEGKPRGPSPKQGLATD